MKKLSSVDCENLKVTIFQAYLFWENTEKNIEHFTNTLNNELNTTTDLIVLPEMFNTAFSLQTEKLAEPMGGRTMQWMHAIASKYNCVVTGSLIIKEKNNFYNRMIWMQADGKYQHYDKHHLFRLGGEDKNFTRGNKQLIVNLKGWKIRLAICYEIRFPVWLRNTNENYDILLVIASWPDRRISHWKALTAARAIENQSFVIAVNRVGADGNDIYHSGNSMCLDPFGNTVYFKPEEEDVFTFSINYNTLKKIRNDFPFLKDADTFTL
ncbi:MAG: nitrilase family protein [Sphingobacteriaceae bacterium]|nr:nitrilase family protein [Sphingobacteriaceae bacterium]